VQEREIDADQLVGSVKVDLPKAAGVARQVFQGGVNQSGFIRPSSGFSCHKQFDVGGVQLGEGLVRRAACAALPNLDRPQIRLPQIIQTCGHSTQGAGPPFDESRPGVLRARSKREANDRLAHTTGENPGRRVSGVLENVERQAVKGGDLDAEPRRTISRRRQPAMHVSGQPRSRHEYQAARRLVPGVVGIQAPQQRAFENARVRMGQNFHGLPWGDLRTESSSAGASLHGTPSTVNGSIRSSIRRKLLFLAGFPRLYSVLSK
jgi:hypothetical protein